MQLKQFQLLLVSIKCIHKSGSSGKDDIYFKVYIDGNYHETYFQGNGLQMSHLDEDNVQQYIDVSIPVTANSTVTVHTWEGDSGNNDDDDLGTITITRDDALEGKKRTYSQSGGEAVYEYSYRVIYKPIPTLRVHGIYCQQSSAGCNTEVLDAVLDAASLACDAASEAIGKVKTPKAIAISKGFEAAAMVIDGVAIFAEWIANAAEGDDDIYLKHIDREHPDADGSGFCPPPSSGQKNMKMNNDQEITFHERFGQYFRFPLDKGDVTIKIMDGDRSSSDDCLGSLTIGESQYNALINEGAQVAVAADYIAGSGQGAVYHLCYSVAEEDWANPPTPPEDDKDPDTWTAFRSMGGQTVVSGPTLTAWGVGALDCFTMASGGDLWARTLENGSWNGGFGIGSGFVNRPGVSYDPSAERIDVVARNNDGYPWHRTRDRNGNWGAWSRIGGWQITAGVALTTWGNGRLDLFVRGSAGELGHIVFSNGAWQYWDNRGGTIKDAPAAAAWDNNRIDIVARGMNDSLWHLAWTGSGWTNWVDLGGGPIASPPSLTACGVGRLECVARSQRGTVLRRRYINSAWTGWMELGNGGAIKDAPGIVHSGNGRLDVVAMGMDDVLWHTTKM